MNRMISFARIMFAGLGIHLSLGIVRNIFTSVAYASVGFQWDVIGVIAASLCISIALLAVVIRVLIVKGDKWAQKLIAKDIQPDQPINIDLTLTMALRLISVGAGILCLRSFIQITSQNIGNIMMSMRYVDQADQVRLAISRTFTVDIIQPVFYLILAAYLLCGAPHFIRWQVKKTLKFCNNFE